MALFWHSMEYRVAQLSDAQTLATFRKQQLIDEGQIPDVDIDRALTEYFEASLANGSLVQYVAVDNNAIVATGGVHFYLYPPSFRNATGKMAYIANIYTMPDFRKKGIATAILDLLVKEAEMRGYCVIRLQATDQGHSVYEKYGFVDTPGFMTLRL